LFKEGGHRCNTYRKGNGWFRSLKVQKVENRKNLFLLMKKNKIENHKKVERKMRKSENSKENGD